MNKIIIIDIIYNKGCDKVEDKQVKMITYLKKTIIILLIITLIVIAGVFSYRFIMKKINTDKFIDYLSENDYQEKKDGSYQKESESDDVLIRYKALSTDSIISKETYENTENDYTSISLKYEKNGNIVIGLQFEGYNKQNNYGVLYQTGNYKDGKFDCQVVTGKGFESKCDILKDKAEDFNSEVKQILEKNEISAKYIS